MNGQVIGEKDTFPTMKYHHTPKSIAMHWMIHIVTTFYLITFGGKKINSGPFSFKKVGQCYIFIAMNNLIKRVISPAHVLLLEHATRPSPKTGFPLNFTMSRVMNSTDAECGGENFLPIKISNLATNNTK